MEIHYSELFFGAVVSIFGFAHFVHTYRNRARILLPDIYISLSSALIGLGPFIAFLLGYRDFPEYSNALLFCYLSFLLFFAGLILAKMFTGNLLFSNRNVTHNGRRSPLFFFIDHCREVPVSNIVFLFFIVVGLKLYEFSVGGGFSGFNTLEVQFSKNYLVTIISHLSRPFSYILYFFVFVSLFKKEKRLFWLTIPILMFLAFDAFTSGRREMLFLVIFALFTSLAIYRRVKLSHVIVGAVFMVGILTIVAPIFLGIRSAGNEARHTIYGTGMASIMEMAVEDVQGVEREQLDEKMWTNVSYRILNVSRVPYTLFLAQDSSGDWMLGRASFHAMTSALPRFIRPYEAWLGTEQFIQLFYGMEMRDVSGSLPMIFIADLGLIGAFLGGIFFGLYLNIGTYFALRLWQNYPSVSMAIFGSLFFLAINTEQAPEFILNLPRNIMLLLILFWILGHFGLKMREFPLFAIGPVPSARRRLKR